MKFEKCTTSKRIAWNTFYKSLVGQILAYFNLRIGDFATNKKHLPMLLGIVFKR